MDREQLEKQIIDKIKEIESSLPGLKEAAKPVDLEESIGRLSRMDAIASQAVNKKTYQMAKQKLSLLRKALEELSNDDFGLCAVCEEPIPYKRILAVPESQLCVNCATAAQV